VATGKPLPDSAFAVVSKTDGKKVRKYPVGDEKQQAAALKAAHQGPSDEHKAVHRAVGSRNKALLQTHMSEAHGGGALKRAYNGITSQFRRRRPPEWPGRGPGLGRPHPLPTDSKLVPAAPPQSPDYKLPPKGWSYSAQEALKKNPALAKRVTDRLKGVKRMAKGGVVYEPIIPHAKWTVVNRTTKKAVGSYPDRHAAIASVVGELERDPATLDQLSIVQSFSAADLVKEAMADKMYR